MYRNLLNLFVAILLLTTHLAAQGRIVVLPVPPDGRVTLQQLKAKILINSGAAQVDLEQTFFNHSSRRLEGTYLFPLPADALPDRLRLDINGQFVDGQVLAADKARSIYTDIVRSLRDPALLEYSDNQLFRARVFPIEPKQARRLQLSYQQVLSFEQGLFRFTLPLRSCGQASIDQMDIQIDIQDKNGIGTVYSPSHQISADRSNERQVRITLHQSPAQSSRDLILYYSKSGDAVFQSLLTFRPRTDCDGYFMWLGAPAIKMNQRKILPRDIIFVSDVSGSMGGEKLQQAQSALNYCLNQLRSEDRFAILRFSSTVDFFKRELVAASAENRANARYYINQMRARGGTNINAALLDVMALKQQKGEKTTDFRPTTIIFITDGLPTEGEQQIGRILENIGHSGQPNIRVFSFGVGYDVNTFLLDKLAADFHGSAQYVKPGENIEQTVQSFFARIDAPVLSDVNLHFAGVDVREIYPLQSPDLFAGQRVLVFGRYRQPGRVKITLSGRQGDQKQSHRYQAQLPQRNPENAFIARLWANRKVTHLLQQIRFNGESPELVQSVKDLALEFGLVTPYTSYLVTEQKKELAQMNSAPTDAAARRLLKRREAQTLMAAEDEESTGSQMFFKSLSSAPRAAVGASGKSAVMSSRIMDKVAKAEQANEMLLTSRYVAGRSFHLQNGFWSEQNCDTSVTVKELDFAGTEYFELRQKAPELAKIFALGSKIVFRWQGVVYRIK